MNNKNIEHFFRLNNSKFGQCLYPTEDCVNKPINAHSIQNSRIFDNLQRNNHLIQIKTRFNNQHRPYTDFVPIGRNDASTFLGLCSIHDNLLFEPIDKNKIDFRNEEQLFLLAYRAVLKEYHAVLAGLMKIQSAYHEKVESGLIPGEDLTKDRGPIEWFIKAYDTYTYKTKYDEAFKNKDFSLIKHRVTKFGRQLPTIACSQLFSADSFEFKDDVLRIVLNVLPVDPDNTVVIFSSTDKEFGLANSYLQRCFKGDEYYKKYEISKQVIRNCENFFINHSFFEKWSNEKKKKIIDYYLETTKSDHDDDSIEYYLF